MADPWFSTAITVSISRRRRGRSWFSRLKTGQAPLGCTNQAVHPEAETLSMKGDPQVLEALNRALTVELTAINQYFCQAKMCKNWGYAKLAAKHYEESMGEMKHAEKLIDRILFLDGTPEIARYDVIRVGTDIKEQFENDLKLEMSGVHHYNFTVDLCMKLKDNGTRELIAPILVESEEHVDWLETQLGLIAAVGLQNYLTEQMGTEEE
jgi:bacterioferritin